MNSLLAQFIVGFNKNLSGAILLIMMKSIKISEYDIHQYFLFCLFPLKG